MKAPDEAHEIEDRKRNRRIRPITTNLYEPPTCNTTIDLIREKEE